MPAVVEKAAQRIAAQLIEQRAVVSKTALAVESVEAATADLQTVDVDSLELTRPRTVGVEQLALWAMQQLNFLDLLAHLGINGAQIAAIVGSIIGRMAGVGSELTASFRRADGKALHVRKATRAEPEQMAIYRALKVNPAPGGISKTIV